jgi:DNA-binding MarR family transcriptional regulator
LYHATGLIQINEISGYEQLFNQMSMRKKNRSATRAPKPSLEARLEGSIRPALGWSFGYVFREADRAFAESFRKDLAPHGITLGQWYFLRELWDEEGLSQRELSNRVGVRESTAGTAIGLMEKRKLVVRTKRPDDHRSFYIYLTPRGRALRNKILALAIKFNERAVQGFTKSQVHALRENIFHIIKNVAAERKR